MRPTASEGALLSAEGLSAAYDGTQVLHEVSLALSPGEMLAVLGPNGSGKSTLLRCLSGTLRPTAGRALLAGRPVGEFPSRRRAQLLAVVPQYSAPSFAFSVWDMAAMGRNPYLGLTQPLGPSDHAAIDAALAQTDCSNLANRLVTELSGGEYQRVILARALAQEPRVLLLDEPTSHLDINHQLHLAALLRALNRDHGLTVLWVTHDVNLASEFCDRVAFLRQGKLVVDGSPSEVITGDRLEEVYGVRLTVSPNPITGRPLIIIAGEGGEAP